MTKVSRNDIYVRDEKGADWFNEFLLAMAGEKPASVQDILNAINNKKSETVAGVVQSYREQVGLDTVQSSEDAPAVKQASAPFRPLSIRHANTETKTIVDQIKSDPSLQAAIDSHCEHSGGTKNIHSLIHYLRELLGKDVSFSDDGLKKYLEERKVRFKEDILPEKGSEDVGRVGLDSQEEHDDDMADFMKYDGAK